MQKSQKRRENDRLKVTEWEWNLMEFIVVNIYLFMVLLSNISLYDYIAFIKIEISNVPKSRRFFSS